MTLIKNEVIGTYRYGKEIMVSTQRVGKGYETCLKHPQITEGYAVFIEDYGTSLDKAIKGHTKWVLKCGGTLKDALTNANWVKDYKITLHALMRVLHQLTAPAHPLVIFTDESDKLLLKLEILNGKYAVSCTYDMAKMEASKLSYDWATFVKEAKSEATERQAKAKLNSISINNQTADILDPERDFAFNAP